MDPFQFLLLAEWLLHNPPNAASRRTAVSRAYFAVHHCVREFVQSAGVHLLGGAESHADVWNHLAGTGDADIERVGSDLADLRSDRNDADYHLTDPRVEHHANAVALVAQARELIAVVKTCADDPSRIERVRKAIQTRHGILRHGSPRR